MDSKRKILISVMIIGVVFISGWWIWNNSPKDIKQSCCAECTRAFSHSPVGTGTEGVFCTHFISGGTSEEFFLDSSCADYFQNSPTKVSECIK